MHVCERKRGYQERTESGVQIGLQAYLRFYEITQGSAKLKSFDDFAKSPYYRAFVKFGRHCVQIRAINVPRFVEWVINQNKKIDHWCHDKIYTEYLHEYLRAEAAGDALTRALLESIAWGDETQHPDRDFLRYGNTNRLCYLINTGRISPWVLYNCESGQQFLANLNNEQIAMVWNMIDTDFWHKKFQQYPADTEYCKHILKQAGW